MPFDLSAVTARANEVMNRGNREGGANKEFKYRLLYPSVGTLSVKLLFNPKANTVSRLVNNHKVNGVNVPCMRTWDQDCPICNALKEIKNVTGTDHPQLRANTRGISLAQYVSSTYEVENINQGDIILLMYPWTVYKDLQQIFQQARTQEELSTLIASNEGFIFDIVHNQDNRYSTQLNAFNKYTSCASEEEFETLLNGLDSLNDLYRPSAPTEDQMNTINDAAKSIRDQFLGNKTQSNFGASKQQSFSPASSVYDDELPFNSRSSSPVPPVAQTSQVPMNNSFSNRSNNSFGSVLNNHGNSFAPRPVSQQTYAQPQQTLPNTTPVGFQAPQVTDSAATMTDHPACFGRYGDPAINPAQCGLCGSDFDCIAASGN